VFFRLGMKSSHTYSTYARGTEALTDTYRLLDVTPYGSSRSLRIRRRMAAAPHVMLLHRRRCNVPRRRQKWNHAGDQLTVASVTSRPCNTCHATLRHFEKASQKHSRRTIPIYGANDAVFWGSFAVLISQLPLGFTPFRPAVRRRQNLLSGKFLRSMYEVEASKGRRARAMRRCKGSCCG